jgi:hypothetical protein
MKKSKEQPTRFTLALISAAFCLFAVQPAQAVEPVYDGKALSEWLVALHANPSDEEVIAATQQNMDPAKLIEQKENRAKEAIRQIGTNGLPALLDLVSVGERNRRSVARRIKNKDIQKCLRDSKPDFREAVRGMAVEGFGILGTNAEPAIPQLTKLLHDNSECLPDVANTLAQIGPKGFAVLTNLANSDLDGILVLAIGQKGGGDVQAVTHFLITALRSSSPITRGNAADYLAGKDANLAIPALIPMLNDPESYYPRERAALALSSYGPTATSAVPTLMFNYTNLIAGTNKEMTRILGDTFLSALKSIDREAAGRAEEFLVNSGPLNGARRGYTRTLLPNGKELIAGGVIDTEIFVITNHFLAIAELFDPKTGKWAETGKMNTARFDHKATLLRNGKVLVEGGNGAPAIPGRFPPSLSSSELYDPVTGTWTVVTNK